VAGALLAGLLATGAMTGKASALGTVSAIEGITSTQVPIAFDPTDRPGNWTKVATASLGSTPYVLMASVGLRDTFTGSPATVECALLAPNEPQDLGVLSFQGIRGSNNAGLSLVGVTSAPFGASPTASLMCHVVGAGSNLVFAHDARIVAIPVDAAFNNLKTGKQP
jgi:hypothetical protein